MGRHLEVVPPERVGNAFIRGELRHLDPIAKIVPEFELAVLLAEEGLEHFVVDCVSQFLVARPRLKAVADDAVNPVDRLFLVGNEDPPETRFHPVGLSLLQKDSWRTLPEGAEDLIADRMDLRGDFVGCDPLTALFAHEDNLVTHGALRDLADVEGAHVHRDPARDGDPLSADQRLPLVGERPAEAVAVADRDRGDPGRPPGDERPSVTDAGFS